ncbi:hypothetical protein CR969_00460 [Candidatus Saccharibacteria bacterium]|nr:MAG: hypothetical protein CR969_00460 [Candidatus Saccharibacteria bacterium]
MIILIDTSTPVCCLTVIDGGEKQHFEWQADRKLAKGLLAFIKDKVGDFHSISGIGVMKGPGSFTGLRIGITVANTLSESLEVPIVGAEGENWQELALDRLKNNQSDKIVLPEYGAEANITKPRK